MTGNLYQINDTTYIWDLLSNAIHLQIPCKIYHIFNICDIKPHLFINASHLISLTYANSLSCSTGAHRPQLPGNPGGFKISHLLSFPLFLSLFLSSLATQVASKSHISCLPFFFHLLQLRWPHGLTPSTGQTSPCTFSRLVDQQISLSHFTSVVSKRFLKCEKKQPGKLGKIPPSTNDYHLLSSVEQPGTCPKRSAVQTQLLVLWGNPKGDCNPGFWYMNNGVWGHAYAQRYENSEEYIA